MLLGRLIAVASVLFVASAASAQATRGPSATVTDDSMSFESPRRALHVGLASASGAVGSCNTPCRLTIAPGDYRLHLTPPGSSAPATPTLQVGLHAGDHVLIDYDDRTDLRMVALGTMVSGVLLGIAGLVGGFLAFANNTVDMGTMVFTFSLAGTGMVAGLGAICLLLAVQSDGANVRIEPQTSALAL